MLLKDSTTTRVQGAKKEKKNASCVNERCDRSKTWAGTRRGRPGRGKEEDEVEAGRKWSGRGLSKVS
eukprot:755525-Hanusia_phi.AAC.2